MKLPIKILILSFTIFSPFSIIWFWLFTFELFPFCSDNNDAVSVLMIIIQRAPLTPATRECWKTFCDGASDRRSLKIEVKVLSVVRCTHEAECNLINVFKSFSANFSDSSRLCKRKLNECLDVSSVFTVFKILYIYYTCSVAENIGNSKCIKDLTSVCLERNLLSQSPAPLQKANISKHSCSNWNTLCDINKDRMCVSVFA